MPNLIIKIPDEYDARENYSCEFSTRQRTFEPALDRLNLTHSAKWIFYDLFDLTRPRFICEDHLIQRRHGNLEGPQVPLESFLIRRD